MKNQQPVTHPPARRYGYALFAVTVGAFAIPCVAILHAADPALSYVTPHGAQRGTEVDVVLQGARLADAQELLLYEPGIEVRELRGDGNQAHAKLAIAADCRLGIHAMRLRTATGISHLRTFFVGPFVEISETEPNSDFQKPQLIEFDVTVNGVIENEDADYYQVAAKKGDRISVEIEALRLGRAFFDPYIAILNTARFELATCDDAALLRQDAHVSIVAPEDGNYIIQVRESAFQGNGNCTYRLHVGRFPRPTAVFPAGGRPGETLEVRWLGDPLGERTETITLPESGPSEFRLFASDDLGPAPSGNLFRLSQLDNVIEVEPNNVRDQATSAAAPSALNGIISESGDADHFRFTAKKGAVYDIRVHARSLRTPLDPVLNIWRSGGAGVAGSDDAGGPDSYLRFTAPEDDDYVLRVRDHLNHGGPDYVYRVEITPIKPGLSMGLPEWDRYVANRAAVPRGGRVAVLVSGGRRDFGGDLNVGLEGLPDGVTLETVTMPGNRNIVPVLLSAAAEAPLDGALVDVVGRAVDESIDVTGHLRQRTWLVRGANNVEVWSHFSDRMGVAVTEPLPYSIEIVQPKVPLVQSGSMPLKIVATRQEGFTAPIAVRMLYNPPGVSASGSVSIAEGQNEAVIPLTAAGNAQIRSWKIAVLGFSNQGGRVIAASQLADLEIAPALLTFAFPKTVVEQGQETNFVVGVTKNRELPSPVKVELLGLPAGATTTPLEVTNETTEISFPIKTATDARAGRHKSILCRAVAVQNEEPITQTTGSGELRIDEPLPPKDKAGG